MEHDFDALARALGAGEISRRKVLMAVVGAATTSLFGLRRPATVTAEPHDERLGAAELSCPRPCPPYAPCCDTAKGKCVGLGQCSSGCCTSLDGFGTCSQSPTGCSFKGLCGCPPGSCCSGDGTTCVTADRCSSGGSACCSSVDGQGTCIRKESCPGGCCNALKGVCGCEDGQCCLPSGKCGQPIDCPAGSCCSDATGQGTCISSAICPGTCCNASSHVCGCGIGKCCNNGNCVDIDKCGPGNCCDRQDGLGVCRPTAQICGSNCCVNGKCGCQPGFCCETSQTGQQRCVAATRCSPNGSNAEGETSQTGQHGEGCCSAANGTGNCIAEAACPNGCCDATSGVCGCPTGTCCAPGRQGQSGQCVDPSFCPCGCIGGVCACQIGECCSSDTGTCVAIGSPFPGCPNGGCCDTDRGTGVCHPPTSCPNGCCNRLTGKCGCESFQCCSNNKCIRQEACPDLGCCSSFFGVGMCIPQVRCPGGCCTGGTCGCIGSGADTCCDPAKSMCVARKDCPAPNAGCCNNVNGMCGCPSDQACFNGTCRNSCLPRPPRVGQQVVTTSPIGVLGTSPLPSVAQNCPAGNVCCGGACCPPALCCNGVCCADGQTCCGGTCCPAGQTCCNGTCCASGQTCRNGACQAATCVAGSCPAGQCCDTTGACVVRCASGGACCNGVCCGPCLECFHGACAINPCVDSSCRSTCPSPQICSPVNCKPLTYGCCYANFQVPPGGCTGNGVGQCCLGNDCSTSGNTRGACIPSGFPPCG